MTVSSSDNYIDPAEVELEADEFESEIEDKKQEITDLEDNLEAEDSIDEQVDIELQIAEAKDELAAIEVNAQDIIDLHAECENYARGSNLISESIFAEYCEEFAYDTGDISRDSQMAFYVDWDKYAEDMKMDYTTITFQGTDFYIQG